jgi:hypothetical protein
MIASLHVNFRVEFDCAAFGCSISLHTKENASCSTPSESRQLVIGAVLKEVASLLSSTSPARLDILIDVKQIARIILCFDLCQSGVVIAVCCLHVVCALIHHHIDIATAC